MTSLSELYAAIASGPLKAVGLRAFDHVPGASEWPGAFLMPPVIEYESQDEKVLRIRFDIVVLVSAAFAMNQRLLLPYQDDQGAKSIPLAFHQNRSLGLAGVDAHILRSRPLTLEEQAGYQAFGASFEGRATLS